MMSWHRVLLIAVVCLTLIFPTKSQDECDSVPDISNANLITQLPSSSDNITFAVGQDIAYECIEGFSLDGIYNGPRSFNATCTAGGAFQMDTTLSCEEMPVYDCLQPPMIENSFLQSQVKEGYVTEDVVVYRCNQEYSLDGHPQGPISFTAQCHQSGIFVFSTGEMPSCIPHVYELEFKAQDMNFHFQMAEDGDVVFSRGPNVKSLSEIESDITDVNSKLDSAKSSLLSSIDIINTKIDDSVTKLEGDIGTVKNDLEDLTNSHDNLKERVDQVELDADDLVQQLEDTKQELDSTKTLLSETETELENTKDALNQLSSRVDSQATAIETLQTQLLSLLNCQKTIGIFDVNKPEAQRCSDKPISAGVSFDDFTCTQATKSQMLYDDEFGVFVCDGTEMLPVFLPPLGTSTVNPAQTCQQVADADAYTGPGLYFMTVNNKVVKQFCDAGGTKNYGGSGLTREEFTVDCGAGKEYFGEEGILWVGASYATAKQRYCKDGQDEGGEGTQTNPGKSCDIVIKIFQKPINNNYYIEGESQPFPCNDGKSASKPVVSCAFLKSQTYMTTKEGLTHVLVSGASTQVYCKNGVNEGYDGSSAAKSSTSCSYVTSVWNKPQGDYYYVEGRRILCGDGSSGTKPADNCWVLKKYYGKGSGVYYVNLGGKVTQAYCDNDRNGGGWTMILSTDFNYGSLNGEFNTGGSGSPNGGGGSNYRLALHGNQLHNEFIGFSPSNRAEIQVLRWNDKSWTYVGSGLTTLTGFSGTCTGCNCGGNNLGGSYYWHGGRGPCWGGAHYGLSRNGDVHIQCNNLWHWGHFHRSGVDVGIYSFSKSCLTTSKWAERFVFFLRSQM